MAPSIPNGNFHHCPFYKIGSKQEPSNHKPLNYTIRFKYCGRNIKSKLTTDSLDHDLDGARQLGFFQWFAYMTDFLNLATKAANDGKSVIVIFLFVTKAFDRE